MVLARQVELEDTKGEVEALNVRYDISLQHILDHVVSTPSDLHFLPPQVASSDD
jgi:hypothetical protein